MNSFIKKLLRIIGWTLCAILLLLVGVLCICGTFAQAWNFVIKVVSIAGGGSIALGVILAPFFIIGIIQLFRAVWLLFEKDGGRVHFWSEKRCRSYNLSWLYVLITVLGILAVFLAICFWSRSV